MKLLILVVTHIMTLDGLNCLSYFTADAFWVGARFIPSTRTWQWLSGRKVEKSTWKQGQPHKNPGKKCVFLDKWSGYHANNFFCGEKYPYICEYSDVWDKGILCIWRLSYKFKGLKQFVNLMMVFIIQCSWFHTMYQTITRYSSNYKTVLYKIKCST